MMQQPVQMKKEFRNKLPFIIRCHVARYGTMDIDEYQSMSGMTEDWDRSTVRRAFNDLVKKGFLRKTKIGRFSKYISVAANESQAVKKFAKTDETFYFNMDMNKFLAGDYGLNGKDVNF